MSGDNKVAKEQILNSYETGLVLSPSDLTVLSDVNKNVLLTNYLTLKGTAFSNIDRECWKYLVSYNIQFFANWDLEEVSDLKLSDISYINDNLIKIENENFVSFLPSLDKSEISPITILACFLWDRMNVYEDHNRDLPVVYNTDATSASELKYRIATKADMSSNTQFVNDVPLFRGKSVLQKISMNTVTKQYSKANQLINKNYKKNEFFTKMENDLYSNKTLVYRDINKQKIIEYLNKGRNINKITSSFNKTSLTVDPILRELNEDNLEQKIINIYNKVQKETYKNISNSNEEKEIVKFQVYNAVKDNFKLIFPGDDKLVSLLAKHLLLGVPIIYSKLPHGLIRTSFNHLKNLPDFTVYWERMLTGRNQKMDQNVKQHLNSAESLDIGHNGGKNSATLSLDVIRLSIYKEIYENCKDFSDFREYLLKVLLKNGIETSKSKKRNFKKRKIEEVEEEEEVVVEQPVEEEEEEEENEQNEQNSLEPEEMMDKAERQNDSVALIGENSPVVKKIKKSSTIKLPPKKIEKENESQSEINSSNILPSKNVENNSIITELPNLKLQQQQFQQKKVDANTSQPVVGETSDLNPIAAINKESPEIDPELLAVDGIPIPETLNELVDVKTLVLDWFSPTTIQIAKLDKTYKSAWRSKEPLKSQYEFQKNFSSTFKKLTKKIIKEGSIKDLNMASATCVERLQEYVDSEFNGDLSEFLKFLNDYKNEHNKVWDGQ